MTFTAWKVSKCGVFKVLYFPVFGLSTGKYGPEITPYLDTFHAVVTWAMTAFIEGKLSSKNYQIKLNEFQTEWMRG